MLVTHLIHLLAQRCALVVNHLLRQVAYAHVRVTAYVSAGGRLLTGNQAQQGRLTCTVLANQCNAVTFVHQKRDTCQDRLGGILFDYIFNT